MADNAGALLVRAGLIGEDQLLIARQHAAQRGGTLGEHLVLDGFIDDEELTLFFHKRLMVPRVDPNQLARIPARMISKVPGDMAAEFRIVPVSVDREQNLTVAMSDPSNTHAVDELGFFTGCYVMRAVATQRQIAWCLAHYYGQVTQLGETLLQPAEGEGEAEQGAADEAEAHPDATQEDDVAVIINLPDDGVPRLISEGGPISITGRVQAERHVVKPPLPADLDDDEPVPAEVPARESDSDEYEAFETHEDLQPEVFGERAPKTSFGDEPTSPTGPMKVLNLDADLPEEEEDELGPRYGEMRARTESQATPLLREQGLPAVVVAEQKKADSVPILLERRARSGSEPPADDGDEPITETPEVEVQPNEEVVVLERPKRPRPRRETNVGIGRLSSSPGIPRLESEDGVAEATAHDDEVTPRMTPLARSADAAHGAPTDGVPEPVPTHVGDEETEKNPTGRFQRIDYMDPEDDGFGPPGSTIPPAFLGAMPDSDESAAQQGIPLLIDASGITGRVASPPGHEAKAKDVTELAATLTAAAEAQRALELSSQKLIETLRRLDVARTRDEAIDCLLDHLIATFACVSFFVIKSGKLCSFRSKGTGEAEMNQRTAELALDTTSTFQDVVRTRLPFSGPLPDRRSRAFAAAILGEEPDEILAMPCAVRDRVVGVLFGANRRNKRIIQEHIAVVARAAGQALERILKTRKRSQPGIDVPH